MSYKLIIKSCYLYKILFRIFLSVAFLPNGGLVEMPYGIKSATILYCSKEKKIKYVTQILLKW